MSMYASVVRTLQGPSETSGYKSTGVCAHRPGGSSSSALCLPLPALFFLGLEVLVLTAAVSS